MLVQESRINQLNSILQYCSQKRRIFTKGERICINQERGYLLNLTTPNPVIIKVFEYSEILDYKINATLREIKQSNWKPFEEIDINWLTGNYKSN
jgi:hypothetical protein